MYNWLVYILASLKKDFELKRNTLELNVQFVCFFYVRSFSCNELHYKERPMARSRQQDWFDEKSVDAQRKQNSSLRIINHQVFTFHFVISMSMLQSHSLEMSKSVVCLQTFSFKTYSGSNPDDKTTKKSWLTFFFVVTFRSPNDSLRWYWYFLLHCNKCAMF